MVPAYAKTFTYHINWRSRGYHDGYHRGAQIGAGLEFRGNSPLVDYPDARRIDIRQTIRDPAEQVHVRVFNQKTSTPIFAVFDLSGSMQFSGQRNKMELGAEVVASIAHSASQSNDPFALIGFDQVVREDWMTRLSTHTEKVFVMTEKLKNYKPSLCGEEGLLKVNAYLGGARALVFLISDFHLSLAMLEKSLNMLSRHHVVPIVIWDADEYLNLPKFGLSTIADLQTGQVRTLFFREALRKKFEQAFLERRQALQTLFIRYQAPPCFVENQFEAEKLSEYFQQFSAI